MSGLILLIEDNSITTKLITDALERESYEVLPCDKGAKALALINDRVPDLIVIDLMLSDVSVVELADQIHNLERCKDVPILALAGYGNTGRYRLSTTQDFADVINKPIEQRRLLGAVRRFLPEPPASMVRRDERVVLLVDDDPVFLSLARKRLESAGFTTISCADPAAALIKALELRPDLIVSDVIMPVIDGYSLCIQIRNAPDLVKTPVFLQTAALVGDEDFAAARQVGATALLSKSAECKELLVMLARQHDWAEGKTTVELQLPDASYTNHLIRRLEKQASNCAGLESRCAIQAAELAVLSGITAALAGSHDLGAALETILDQCIDAIGMREGAVYLIDRNDMLKRATPSGSDRNKSCDLIGDGGIASALLQIARGGRAVHLQSNLPDEQFDTERKILGEVGLGTCLIVPLIHVEEILGVMVMATADFVHEDRDWLNFAESVGQQIAQSLVLARSFEKLRVSEQRSTLLMEHASDAILVLDGRGVIVEANREFQRIIGRTRAQLIGGNWLELVPIADRAAADQKFKGSSTTGMHRVVGGCLERADGSALIVDISSSRVDVEGEARVIFIIRDLSERIRMDASLTDSQQLLQALLDGTQAAIYVKDRAGRYLLVNRNFERMFGREDHSSIGKTDLELFDPEAARVFMSNDQGIIDSRTASEFEEVVTDAEASRVFFSLKSPLFDRAGEVWAICGVSTDVTAAHRAEREVQNQREKLHQTEKVAAMGTLLAGVAHELNNPLSVVVGQASLLRHRLTSDKEIARADKIVVAAKRCAHIVETFLSLARKKDTQKISVKLSDVIRDSIDLLAYSMRVDSIEIVKEEDADCPNLLADPHQIMQVVINLVSNAHHELRKIDGCKTIWIRARFNAGEQVAVLEVEDSGGGIDEVTIARIFEPFFTTKIEGEGTGLGLSLCREIVERHGGTISVQSPPGRGACFQVKLPIEGATFASETAPDSMVPVPLAGRRILVVDDEPEVAGLLVDLLTMEGYKVDSASDGEEALRILAQSKYDLILADMKMPVLDGPGLYKRLLTEHEPMSRKIIFLTGDTLSADTVAFAKASNSITIAKPFRQETILKAIHQVLGPG